MLIKLNIYISLFSDYSLDDILDTDDVPAHVDEALGLVAVGEVVDDAVGEEVGGDGVAPETSNVGPEDTEDLVEELLDKGRQAAVLKIFQLNTELVSPYSD